MSNEGAGRLSQRSIEIANQEYTVDGGIPHTAYEGFSREFCESEIPLHLTRDWCMRIDEIMLQKDLSGQTITRGGSFFVNGTSRFLGSLKEELKRGTHDACNAYGYESVALIPIRSNGNAVGLVLRAGQHLNRVHLREVEFLEEIAVCLGFIVEHMRTLEKLWYSE